MHPNQGGLSSDNTADVGHMPASRLRTFATARSYLALTPWWAQYEPLADDFNTQVELIRRTAHLVCPPYVRQPACSAGCCAEWFALDPMAPDATLAWLVASLTLCPPETGR